VCDQSGDEMCSTYLWKRSAFIKSNSRYKQVNQPYNTPLGRREERKYSSYSFTTSALDGVSCQRHDLVALCPRERTSGTHCTGGCQARKPRCSRNELLMLQSGVSSASADFIANVISVYDVWVRIDLCRISLAASETLLNTPFTLGCNN
jgi:hypothetical protein